MLPKTPLLPILGLPQFVNLKYPNLMKLHILFIGKRPGGRPRRHADILERDDPPCTHGRLVLAHVAPGPRGRGNVLVLLVPTIPLQCIITSQFGQITPTHPTCPSTPGGSVQHKSHHELSVSPHSLPLDREQSRPQKVRRRADQPGLRAVGFAGGGRPWRRSRRWRARGPRRPRSGG